MAEEDRIIGKQEEAELQGREPKKVKVLVLSLPGFHVGGNPVKKHTKKQGGHGAALLNSGVEVDRVILLVDAIYQSNGLMVHVLDGGDKGSWDAALTGQRLPELKPVHRVISLL